MRNKYSRQLQQHQQQRSTFLPMLCSSSSKEVKVSHRRCASSSSSSVSEEPSSPKVGCMGQVKRNNKVVGFPTIIGFIGTNSNTTNNNHVTNSTILKNEHNSTTTTSSSTISIVKYHKLKKFFSSKSLTTSPTATAARTARCGTHKPKSGARNVAGVDHMHHGRSTICRSKTDEHKNSNTQKVSIVNLEELDPPLPVVKKVQKQEQEEGSKGENLWKRRSGGAPLRSLQVQVIHHNPALLPPPASTV